MTSDKYTPNTKQSSEERAFDQRLTNAYQNYKQQTLADYKRKKTLDKLLQRKSGGTHWQPVWSVALMASFALVVFVLTLPQQDLLRQEARFDSGTQKMQQPTTLEDVADIIHYEQDQVVPQASEVAEHKAEKQLVFDSVQAESAPAITLESVQADRSPTEASTLSKTEADAMIKNQAIAAQRKVKESLKPASPAVQAEVQVEAAEQSEHVFEEETAERVIVTGSRIKRSDVEEGEPLSAEPPIMVIDKLKVEAPAEAQSLESTTSKVFIGKIVVSNQKYTLVNCAHVSIEITQDWLASNKLAPGDVIEVLLEQNTTTLIRKNIDWPCPEEPQD